MFEFCPELYINLCTAFIDLSTENEEIAEGVDLAKQEASQPKLRPFERKLIVNAYTQVDKKAHRNKNRAGAAPTINKSSSMYNLKELQGCKSEARIERDSAVRKLMEYTRESCRVEWAGTISQESKPSHLPHFGIDVCYEANFGEFLQTRTTNLRC